MKKGERQQAAGNRREKKAEGTEAQSKLAEGLSGVARQKRKKELVH